MTYDNSVATEGVDVLVIGGGQAGLAMGYYLAERGLSFVIADANPEVGDMWRSRWQSLRLFTAGQYNNLPGLPFPAARDVYPGKDAVADFLKSYAENFELPVRLNTTVTRLTRDDGRYRAETTTGPIEADQVVVATGPFQVPFTPEIANELDPDLAQLHSAEYRGAEDLPEGRILVVGAANSGHQIALELAQSREVDIAVGQKLPTLPQRPFGRDIWWWLRPRGWPGFRFRRGLASASLSVTWSSEAGCASCASTASSCVRERPPPAGERSPSRAGSQRTMTAWSGRPDSGSTTRGLTFQRSGMSAARSATSEE